MTRRPGTGATAALPAVAALLLAFLLAGSAAAAATGGKLRIYAPGDGAVLPPGKALVVGSVPAGYKGESVTVEVNGKVSQEVAVKGGVFTTSVYLVAGKNVLVAKAGDQSITMAILASDQAVYRYHPDVEKCSDCHGDTSKGYAIPGPKDSLCYKCHDRLDAGKFLHGPLATGECNACHNPHGSGQPKLVSSRYDTLCVTCHDQKSSEAHFRKTQGKECVGCHDPHSAPNQHFLKAAVK